MDELALLHNYLIVGAMLFGLGMIGFFTRRNMIVMFLAAEMMLQGVSVSLVAWGRFHNDWGGQMLVIFILTVAACEAGLALAAVVTLFQRKGNLDIAAWTQTREADQPAYMDRELPEDREDEAEEWPKLSRSGVEPTADPEQTLHRDHV